MHQDKLENSESKASLGNIKSRIIYHRLLGASVGVFAVFVLAFIMAPTLVAEASAVTDLSANVTWRTLSLALDPDVAATEAYTASGGTSGSALDSANHGDIDFGDIIPTSADDNGNVGTQKVVKKTIGITSEGKYYSVYLSMSGSSASLVTSGDTTQSIAPIAGSWSSPANFTSSSWGYAVPKDSAKSTSFITPFDPTETGLYTDYDDFLANIDNLGSPDANNLTKQGLGSSVYNTGTWAAVPVLGFAQQIWKNQTANATGFHDGDTFDIYYSIMVDNDIMAGNYSNSVIYTAFASTASLDTVSSNLARDNFYVTSGTEETINLDLATTDFDLSTSNVNIYLVPHTTFTSNNYSVSELNPASYAACDVTDIESNNKPATITCTMPTINSTTVMIADDSTTENGVYDLWVRIKKSDGSFQDYVSHYKDDNNHDTPTIGYIGLQSKNASGINYVTKMQQMTPAVCKNTNQYTTSSQTYSLTDVRDSAIYEVRKLTDEDCWMINDLQFVGTHIEPETTNISVSKELNYDDFTEAGISYSELRIHADTNTTNERTVWYNYAALSAGTVTGEENEDISGELKYNLCPAGWTVPTLAQYNSILPEKTAFSPTIKGLYNYSGENVNTTMCFYWTSTRNNAMTRFNYQCDTADGWINTYRRSWGLAARCVARD